MYMKKYLIVFSLFLLISGSFGNEKAVPETKKTNISQDSMVINHVVFELKDIDRLEQLFAHKERSILSEYGAVLVAVVALFGAVITSIMGNRRSRLNTEKQITANTINFDNQLRASTKNLNDQLNANSKNLQDQLIANSKNLQDQLSNQKDNISQQMKASRELEIEKKSIDIKQNTIFYLKNSVAKFINIAVSLNDQLGLIYQEIDEGRELNAKEMYSITSPLREQLKDIYYSIKVSLDDSKNQLELENIIDQYMNVVHFKFEIRKFTFSEYSSPINDLYLIIRAIGQENILLGDNK